MDSQSLHATNRVEVLYLSQLLFGNNTHVSMEATDSRVVSCPAGIDVRGLDMESTDCPKGCNHIYPVLKPITFVCSRALKKQEILLIRMVYFV
jgi:hypothetical protein